MGSTLKPGTVVGLKGSLGAGKTTFTRGVARGLGIGENITSPTYTLISVYDAPIPLYHMDLYRIADEEEFFLLGADEIVYGEGICIIEWFEGFVNSLPDHMIIIEITINEDMSRTITLDDPSGELDL